MSSLKLLNYALRMLALLICTSILSPLQAQDPVEVDQVAFDAEGWKRQNSVTPPSPEAASLGNYGNVPLNYYNGNASISVPLGSIGGQQIGVPISLNYDASSVKVASLPSWAGLGWNLTAGGVITRSAQGMPDTWNYFTWKNHHILGEFASELTPEGLDCENRIRQQEFYRHVMIGDIDLKPDVFYFSFPGGSGSFVYDYNGNIIQREKNDLIINTIWDNEDITGFVVTDISGVQYQFGYAATERTEYISTYNDGFDENTVLDPDSYPLSPEKSFAFNSSWYLISITSPDGAEEILLDYQTIQENFTDAGGNACYKSVVNIESDNSVQLRRLSVAGYAYDQIPSNGEGDPDRANPRIYNRLFPDEVRFKLAGEEIQKAVFNAVHLTETEEAPLSSGVKLEDIRTYTKFRGSLEEAMLYDFEYNFSTGRLTLASVQEKGKQDTGGYDIKPPYSFSYKAGELPPVRSNAIDFWGYYNGAGANPGLIPSYWSNDHWAYNGANRKASSAAGRALLASMTYPTGGSTSFHYEANRVGDDLVVENFGSFVGGMRLHEIVDDPGNGSEVTRSLRYVTANNEGSGKLLHSPLIVTSSVYTTYPDAGNPSTTTTNTFTIFAFDATKFGTIQNGHIGYSRVEEIIGTEGSNIGKNVYHFRNSSSGDFWHATNGQLLLKEVLDKDGNPVRTEESVYDNTDSGGPQLGIYDVFTDGDQDNRNALCATVEGPPGDEDGSNHTLDCEGSGYSYYYEWQVANPASPLPACHTEDIFKARNKLVGRSAIRIWPRKMQTIATDYFPGGNVVQTTDYEYEAPHNLTLLTARQSNNSDGSIYRTEIEYGQYSNGIRAIPEIIRQAKDGSVFGGTRRVYDDLGHVLNIYELVEGGEEVLRATISEYNAAARPSKYIYMSFPQEVFTWENGLLTQRTYGGNARIWNYDYDNRRQLIYEQDIDEQEVHYDYDGLGRLQEIRQREDNIVTSFTYNLGGDNSIEELTIYDDAPPQEIIRYFDGLGRPTKTDVNNVTKHEQFYDEFSRVIRQTYLPGTYTSLSYEANPLSRLTEELYPDNNSVGYVYDAEDNYFTQERINERDFSTISTTDLVGQVKEIEDAIGGITNYTYDARGNILTIGSPAGAYAYAYDQRFRLVSKSVPGAEAMTYCYDDANDLMCRSRDGNGNQLSTVYDEYGRELEVYHQVTASASDCDCTTAGTQVISNQYDQGGAIYNGKLNRSVVRMLGASGQVITDYTLDNYGRVDFESQDVAVDGINFDYNIDTELNHADWLVSSNYQVTSTQNFAGGYNETFAYDDFGRVTMHAAGGLTTRMRYNDADQMLYKVYDDNLQRQDYLYNIRGWLTDINIARPEVLRQSDISDTDPSLCEPQTGDDDSYVATELVPPSEFFELLCSGQDVIIPGLDTCLVVYPPEEECTQILKNYTLRWTIDEHDEASANGCTSYGAGAEESDFSSFSIEKIFINTGTNIEAASLDAPYTFNFGTPNAVEQQRLVTDLSTWLQSIDTLSYPFDSVYVVDPFRRNFSLHVDGSSFVSLSYAIISINGDCCKPESQCKGDDYLGPGSVSVQKYFSKTLNRREDCIIQGIPAPGGGSGTLQPQLPTILHEVILSDGRKEWYFTEELATISGAYTTSKQIRVNNTSVTFSAQDANGQQTNLSLNDLLTLRTTQSGLFEITIEEEGEGNGPTIECPPTPPGCDATTAAQQQESIENICARTIEAFENGTLTPPYNIALVQLCDGSYTYVTADRLTEIYGSYNVLDEITIDSEDDLITVQIRNEEMRFAMHFDHQPNGNIERMKWKISNRATDIYDLVYDPLDRVTEANYAQEYYWEEVQNAGTSNEYVSRQYVFADYAQTYNTAYTYDGGGNIMTLWRNGLGSSCLGPGGRIDDLTYTYGGLGGKQLVGVADAAPENLRPYGFKPYGSPFPGDLTYTYDLNGNMTHDPHKELDFVYNFLNLPQQVNGPDTDMEVVYDAGGGKWKKESAYKDDDGNTISKTTLYVGAFEFEETPEHSLRLATTNAHEDGRTVKLWDQSVNGDVPDRLEYYHKDHLGNVRLTFSDLNQDGAIMVGSIYGPLNEIVFEKHYYPFGMDMTGAWFATVAPDNSRKYNQKEWDEAVGLYDYGARYYDPALARWTGVDPLADEYVAFSPYSYTINNPIRLIDPNGMSVFGDVYNLNGVHIGSDGKNDNQVYLSETRNNVQLTQDQVTFITSAANAKNNIVPAVNLTRTVGISHDEFKQVAATLYSEMDFRNPNATEAAAIYNVLENRQSTSWGQGKSIMEIATDENNPVYGYGGDSYKAAMAERALKTTPGYSRAKHNKAREGLIMALTNPNTDYSNGAHFWEGTEHLSKPGNFFRRHGNGTTKGRTGIITYDHTVTIGGTTFMKYNQTNFSGKKFP